MKVRMEKELALAHAEMTMVRWMCGVHKIKRYSGVVLRDGLGLEEDIFFREEKITSCYDETG